MQTLGEIIMDFFFPPTQKDYALQPTDIRRKVTVTVDSVPASTHCVMCGGKIQVMSFKGAKVCSTRCSKAARGETSDGWIETRAGRVKPYIGKKVRFDLIDPYLHIEGMLEKVEDREGGGPYRRIFLTNSRTFTKTVRNGQTVDRAMPSPTDSYNLPLDHRIDFKP